MRSWASPVFCARLLMKVPSACKSNQTNLIPAVNNVLIWTNMLSLAINCIATAKTDILIECKTQDMYSRRTKIIYDMH